MARANVRISVEHHKKLAKIAEGERRSMTGQLEFMLDVVWPEYQLMKSAMHLLENQGTVERNTRKGEELPVGSFFCKGGSNVHGGINRS